MHSPTLLKSIATLVLSFLISCNIYSQSDKKQDVVVKLNGDQLSGKVLEINDSTIRFVHSGEDLVYTIRKSEIARITFASGRAETFNPPHPPASGAPAEGAPAITTSSSAEDRRNKVAILPFTFIKDGQPAGQVVGEQVQNECFALLSKHAGVYTVVSPRAINVKLAKAGINKDNLLNYTMEEVCHILGVEYILDAAVTQNRTRQTSYGNNTYSGKTKDNGNEKKETGYGSTYATTVQNFETVMDMKIYNDKSEIVYNQNRKAFWNTEDAYRNTMEYLVKRCPLYTK